MDYRKNNLALPRLACFMVAIGATLGPVAALGAGPASQLEPANPGAPPGRIAREAPAGARFGVVPNVDYETASLSIRGRGEIELEREFGAGEPVSLALVDSTGAYLPDGQYSYRFKAWPPSEGRPIAQTGTFFIDNGSAISHEAVRTRLAAVREELHRAPAPPRTGGVTPPNLLLEPDGVSVLDSANDNTTFVAMNSDFTDSWWLMQNTFSNFNLAYQDVDIPYPGTTVLHIDFKGVNKSYWGINTIANDGNLILEAENFPEIILRDPVNGNDVEFELQSNGDTHIDLETGNALVVNGDFLISSSRRVKENLTPVSSEAVLNAVLDLPLYRWSYRSNERAARHLGPTAEDFFSRTGLGSDKHIAPTDTAGVTLAAIQELHALIQKQAAEIERLRVELDQLKAEPPVVSSRLRPAKPIP